MIENRLSVFLTVLLLFFASSMTLCRNRNSKEQSSEKAVNIHIDKKNRPELEQRITADSIIKERTKSKGQINDTISLSSYGVKGNGSDETLLIQRALNAAKGRVLYIPRQTGNYYLSGQLIIPSNITIICNPKVVFLAKDNLEQDIRNFEVLFRFEGSENVVFQGNGAVFKMHKDKYSGEHNHLFMVNGAKNITIKNVRVMSAGGDGFYVGAYKTRKPFSENVKFYNCIATQNRRQGMSVTSVDGLLVENCEFSYTQGTRPESGVDIEPSLSTFALNNILFKNCIANSNKGRGFQVTLIKVGAESNSVNVIFEDCKATANDIGFSNRYFAEESKGIVRFVNCVAEASKESGFWEGSCSADGAKKEYINCKVIIDAEGKIGNELKGRYPGFCISNFEKRKKATLGNSSFVDCQIIDSANTLNIKSGIDILNTVPVKNILVKNFKLNNRKGNHISIKNPDVNFKKGISIIN